MQKSRIALAGLNMIALASVAVAQAPSDQMTQADIEAARAKNQRTEAEEVARLRAKLDAAGTRTGYKSNFGGREEKAEAMVVAIDDIKTILRQNGYLASDPWSDIARIGPVTFDMDANFVERSLLTCAVAGRFDDPAKALIVQSMPSQRQGPMLVQICRIYWAGYVQGAGR